MYVYMYIYIARVTHMNDTGMTDCLAVAFWVQGLIGFAPYSSGVPKSLMAWGCCRRRVVVEEEESWEVGISAPECPQGHSPGGSIYQRSQVTGLVRRQVRTSSEELERFQLELEARLASAQPARGGFRWLAWFQRRA